MAVIFVVLVPLPGKASSSDTTKIYSRIYSIVARDIPQNPLLIFFAFLSGQFGAFIWFPVFLHNSLVKTR